jgi:hypothetical protein
MYLIWYFCWCNKDEVLRIMWLTILGSQSRVCNQTIPVSQPALSMEPSAWKAKEPQLVKKAPTFLQNKKVNYRVQGPPPSRNLYPSLTQVNSVYGIPSCFSKFVLIASTRLDLILLSGCFPSGAPTKISNTFLLHRTRAKCPAHLPWFHQPSNNWCVQNKKLVFLLNVYRAFSYECK